MSEPAPDRDGYYIPPDVSPQVFEQRWWLHEAIRCLVRQSTALRIFYRPTVEHKLGQKNAELKALLPGIALLLEKEWTEEELQVEWMMSRVVEVLDELESAAGIRNLEQEGEWIDC